MPIEIIVAWTVSGLRGLAWEPAQIQILITHAGDDTNGGEDCDGTFNALGVGVVPIPKTLSIAP